FSRQVEQYTETDFFKKLRDEEYDKNHRPPGESGKKQLTIRAQIEIGYMGSIDSKAMTFELHASLRHWWTDVRLKYNESLGRRVFGMKSLRDEIWTPTLFFNNEKESQLVSTTKDNIYVQIQSNGSVYYSLRLRLTLSCPMNLKNYPFDKQKCRIIIMSWLYGSQDLRLKWKKDCVIFLESVELPEHFLDKDNVECSSFNRTYYTAGEFSGVEATLSFRREIPFYLMEVYLPVSLLVIVSWLSFWLDVYAVPARTALGITTILTVITNSSGVKESIPRVSYVKAVDIWIQLCTFLVFCAFLEFPFVNFIARKGQKSSEKSKTSNPANASKAQPSLFKIVKPTSATNKVSCTESSQPAAKQTTGFEFDDEENKLDFCHIFPQPSEDLARAIDRVSRFLFPFIFVIFNLIYWFKWLA
ncbi:glutamate-gated chloride channel-like, partial [Centruroides vittatus]|uniref:glutamate-gated chloride channel-like n=1 Tax=Centruroides vittatus TaxID=120091 RepID=UPI00350ED593